VEEKLQLHYHPVFDDVTGGELDPALVEKGEMEEMETFKRRKVYEYVLRGEMQKNPNGKIDWCSVGACQ
jgi:hypothetical protein